MIVTFLKDHVHHKKDQTADIPENTALYLLKCRVVTVKDETGNVDKILDKQLKKTIKKPAKKK